LPVCAKIASNVLSGFSPSQPYDKVVPSASGPRGST
jgi:hypothetical protein